MWKWILAMEAFQKWNTLIYHYVKHSFSNFNWNINAQFKLFLHYSYMSEIILMLNHVHSSLTTLIQETQLIYLVKYTFIFSKLLCNKWWVRNMYEIIQLMLSRCFYSAVNVSSWKLFNGLGSPIYQNQNYGIKQTERYQSPILFQKSYKALSKSKTMAEIIHSVIKSPNYGITRTQRNQMPKLWHNSYTA
jgi:hypothetical protein